MDREEYLNLLEEGNGYCNCPELGEFYKLRRGTQDSLSTKAIRKYNAKMTVLIHRGKLELMSHDIKDKISKTKAFPKDIGTEKIITVHCPVCSQQIDTLD